METPRPKNDARHLHGQGRPMHWRTGSAVLLLVLGIVLKTASGSGERSFSQRVVGGHDAELGRWPWQGCLTYNSRTVCGASLISRYWAVTAAHCVANRNVSNFHVVLGTLNLTGPSPTKLYVAVIKILIHDIYSGDGTSGDLALLELEKPVNFNRNIQPITLPSQNQEIQKGAMCWLTGWGYTAENVKLTDPYTLQEVELPLINSSDCDKIFQAAYNLTFAPEYVKEDMICAGYLEGKKDGCQGDSGGPLACPSGDSWLLVGIVSWGDGCAQPQRPGVYTKVSSFSSWIQEKTTDPELKIYTTTVQMSPPITQRPEASTTVEMSPTITQRPEASTTVQMSPPITQRPEASTTVQMSPPITQRPEASTTVEMSPTITQRPEVSTTIEMSPPITQRPEGSATVKINSPITERPKAASQALTLPKVIEQGNTSAGRRLQISTSLVVTVIALTRILGIV